MLTVKGIYDGKEVKLLETVRVKKGSEVIVTFLHDNIEKNRYFYELYDTVEGDSSCEEIKSIEYRLKE